MAEKQILHSFKVFQNLPTQNLAKTFKKSTWFLFLSKIKGSEQCHKGSENSTLCTWLSSD